MPINPFLRAFFRSALPAQCQPITHHILLVPTTDVLVHSKDRETGSYLADLAGTEDFLASHVIRIAGGVPPGGSKDYAANKGKAKQYTTINGRTVVIKDSFVYSNRGFKTLNQAQLLADALFYPDTSDNQQWTIYYISKPLVGTTESIAIKPAALPLETDKHKAKADQETDESQVSTTEGSSAQVQKKDVKTFGELLNAYPLIARHMHAGLERIFRDFTDRFDRPDSHRPPRPASVRSVESSKSLEDSLASLRTSISNSPTLRDAPFALEPEEETMREALESAVTAAIDLFQGVDKQQLSLLGANTNLSGPAVEGLIEKYVSEQLHERALFPELCRIHREDDSELESRIRRMLDIDIAQVGIDIEGGKPGKRDLALRLDAAVANFKKQGVAGSPHEMIETLLATTKTIATGSAQPASGNEAEKQALALTMNADTLVSMLLIVVIRSGVRHLNARLSYMKNFVFIDDVDIGETGYALSTLEAVLMYLGRSSDPMRRASRRNRDLWQAVKNGDIASIQATLEPNGTYDTTKLGVIRTPGHTDQDSSDDAGANHIPPSSTTQAGPSILSRTNSLGDDFAAVGGSLSHVFPFQRPPTPPPEADRPKRKRVMMAPTVRSASASSIFSSGTHSRRASTSSVTSSASAGFSADTSLAILAQTQNVQGDSLLMMAIEAGQTATLEYLLTLDDYFPLDFVLDDSNTEGTTLLCAAVQSDHLQTTMALLLHIVDKSRNVRQIREYIRRRDSKGRCMAHYLFNQPEIIDEIGELIPWRLRDKNGQTPLFALCRSYDHPQYKLMVDKALTLAAEQQPDRGPLHLDDHVDSKGNTLLHIVHNVEITAKLLRFADADVNAANDKKFTPFMVASKYGKLDLARVLFADPRVELQARDIRGLTAIELAKDDEIRNRIDDMMLLSRPVGPDGRITGVIRSMFVDDASVRVILKSGQINSDGSIMVTTCRRGLRDFEFLAEWLTVEQPASWLPTQFTMASPFLIPSKPSRAVLRDIQLRLDNFLHNLLNHTTFSHHEMVWEFFLIPDMDAPTLSERSRHKALARTERVRDEYEPITDTSEVEIFVGHAYDQVRRLSSSTRHLIRRVNRLRQGHADLHELATFSAQGVNTLAFLPSRHKDAMTRWAATLAVPDASSPLASLYYALHSISSTTQALLVALNRPTQLVAAMDTARQSLDRSLNSLGRQSRWTPNIGFFDETRRAIADEAQEKAHRTQRDLDGLGSELRYTQTTVAAELAGWQSVHVKEGRRVIRDMVQKTLVKERERLEGMRRALRVIRGE